VERSIAQRSGIYLIAGPNGGVYIGSAQHFGRRWIFHRSLLRRGKHHSPHLQHTHDKYGLDSLHFMVLAFVDDAPNLYAVEQEWLDFVFDVVPRHRIYNVTRAANGATGRTATEETRRRLSAALRGKKRTLETRRRMSEGRMGMKFSSSHCDNNALAKSGGKVYTIVAPSGKVYSGVVNITAFAREHGMPVSNMSMMAGGHARSIRGWRVFLGDPPPIRQQPLPGFLIDE
jgi:group I intron endonuclease